MFVDLDPGRDSPAALRRIASAAGSPSLLALTGDAEGGRARLLQSPGRLGRIVAIQPRHVDGRPGGISQPLHQGFDGAVAGGLIVAPEQMDGHQDAARGRLGEGGP